MAGEGSHEVRRPERAGIVGLSGGVGLACEWAGAGSGSGGLGRLPCRFQPERSSVSVESGPERFELRIQIQPDDIDELGHVNNVVYLRWVQDVATAHWRAAAPAGTSST